MTKLRCYLHTVAKFSCPTDRVHIIFKAIRVHAPEGTPLSRAISHTRDMVEAPRARYRALVFRAFVARKELRWIRGDGDSANKAFSSHPASSSSLRSAIASSGMLECSAEQRAEQVEIYYRTSTSISTVKLRGQEQGELLDNISMWKRPLFDLLSNHPPTLSMLFTVLGYV